MFIQFLFLHSSIMYRISRYHELEQCLILERTIIHINTYFQVLKLQGILQRRTAIKTKGLWFLTDLSWSDMGTSSSFSIIYLFNWSRFENPAKPTSSFFNFRPSNKLFAYDCLNNWISSLLAQHKLKLAVD